jgi:hypothetical protein
MQLQGAGGHCPVLAAGGEEWAFVVVGVTGPLDSDACVAGPMTETAAWAGSQASFTLADDLPPAKVPRDAPNNQANQGAYHWTHLVLSPLFDLQSSGGGSRNNLFCCIELLCIILCFSLASYFNRLCT